MVTVTSTKQTLHPPIFGSRYSGSDSSTPDRSETPTIMPPPPPPPPPQDTLNTYSIPASTRQILTNLLHHPHHPNLPPEITKHDLSSSVTYTGSTLPRIAVPWRFAESAAALKGLEACLLNALLMRKYTLTSPARVTINTDHASLFIMSPFLVELDPSEAINTTSLFESQAKFASSGHFPNRDVHSMSSSFLRRGVSNIYRAADGRFLHTHASFDPGATLAALGLARDDAGVASLEEGWRVIGDRVAQRSAEEWDRVLGVEAKLACTVALTAEEYRASEQGRACAGEGLWRVEHVASGAQANGWWAESASPKSSVLRPLAGLKVLDLTRVIASPTITRGLAEWGASVMRITAPHLPDYSGLHPDLNWGKWNCELDLRTEDGRQKAQALLREADVVVNGYRPGVLDKYGLGFEDVQRIGDERGRGFIYVRENCFGWKGPMRHRSGWQPVSDAHTGVSWGFGRAMGLDEPVTPVLPNSDFGTGILGVCAVLQALMEQSEKGGSFLVDTALDYYNRWLVEDVGLYPDQVWQDVWQRCGKKVFRHHHNIGYILSPYMKMCNEQGLFQKEFLEVRESGVLGGLRMRSVRPVLQFPDGTVRPGFNVGTRGNGVDCARWPEDLMTEKVV
jgi:hypothetical protein